MTFFDFVFGLIVFSSLLGVAVVAASILGITKVVRYASRRLTGRKEPKRIEGGHIHPGMDARNQSRAPHAPEGVSRAANGQGSGANATNGRGAGTHYGSTRNAENQGARYGEGFDPKPRSYEYLDIDDGVDANKIRQVLRPYLGDQVVGSYAHHVFQMLDACDLRRKSLFSQINDKFEKGTISWDRFASTANAALDALLRNGVLLANRVQAFDVADYQRMHDFFASGGAQRINTQDQARLQRWRILHDAKAEMDGIQAADEGLLLELSKLESELTKLSIDEASDANASIAEEVRKLADETKYYR